MFLFLSAFSISSGNVFLFLFLFPYVREGVNGRYCVFWVFFVSVSNFGGDQRLDVTLFIRDLLIWRYVAVRNKRIARNFMESFNDTIIIKLLLYGTL
jgi:hypothetical protein